MVLQLTLTIGSTLVRPFGPLNICADREIVVELGAAIRSHSNPDPTPTPLLLQKAEIVLDPAGTRGGPGAKASRDEVSDRFGSVV